MNRFEVGAVVATGILHLVVSEAWGLSGPYIVAAFLFWAVYVGMRVRADPRVLGDWGLRRTHLGAAFLASSALAAIALLSMAVWAQRHGTLRLHAHLVPLLVLYPVWGLLQQLLVQGLVGRNLLRVGGDLARPVVVVGICATLFALVHLPDPTLTLATFLLGLVFTPLYLRWRNLWPLGLYHGWLGAFFYFWVLGRDPWLEMLGGA